VGIDSRRRVATDAAGVFVFGGVPAGVYRLSVPVDGCPPTAERQVWLQSCQAETSVIVSARRARMKIGRRRDAGAAFHCAR
jgi:hypothetical protein